MLRDVWRIAWMIAFGSIAVAPVVSAQTGSTLDKVKAAGVVKVCVAQISPEAYKDAKTGQWSGVFIDLTNELQSAGAKVDLTELEQGFTEAAAAYSARKGISYAAWRELGVEASVLKRAGISRSS